MTEPNILFVLIDDMGWKDLACYGSSFYETPRIDQLAGEGMQFSNAYASCPVCSPTRASILTGKYPAALGVTNFIGGDARGKVIDAPYIRQLPLEENNLAKIYKAAGYRTYHIGKWHLGTEEYWPEKQGFDINIGGCDMGHPRGGYFSPYNNPMLPDGPEGEYLTDRLTDEALRLLDDNGDSPFFMYWSHYAVHTPIQSPEKLVAKYKQKAVDMGLDRIEPFEEGPPFPCEHKRNKNIKRRLLQSDPWYAAVVENLDMNIGRILDKLDELGLAEHTIVIFTSDNGGLSTAEGSPTCNAPLAEGKGWMYEGGTREPLIIRWPEHIKAGSTCDIPVTSPDFLPTLLEAAGLPDCVPEDCEGLSLLPLLKQAGGIEREGIFWHYPHYGNQGGTPGASVRSGDWKLIEFFEDNEYELYNLAEDEGEEHNLITAQPEIAETLKKLLKDWQTKVEARYPEPNPEWEIL